MPEAFVGINMVANALLLRTASVETSQGTKDCYPPKPSIQGTLLRPCGPTPEWEHYGRPYEAIRGIYPPSPARSEV